MTKRTLGILCLLLGVQLLFCGCYPNLPVYAMEDDGNLTDGMYVYEPFFDSEGSYYGWAFNTEASVPCRLDENGKPVFETRKYGIHTKQPVGKRKGGNLIDGFQNDPQRLFIQERSGFGMCMIYRIRKRRDISLPSIADADIAAQDVVTVSYHGNTMVVQEQDVVTAIVNQYLQAQPSQTNGGMGVDRVGSISFFFHDLEVTYYRIQLYAGKGGDGVYYRDPGNQSVRIEDGTPLMALLKQAEALLAE